jgi:hypothetical protein
VPVEELLDEGHSNALVSVQLVAIPKGRVANNKATVESNLLFGGDMDIIVTGCERNSLVEVEANLKSENLKDRFYKQESNDS